MCAAALELQAIFDSSVDGITLIDQHGQILRENLPARQWRLQLEHEPKGMQDLERVLFAPARLALDTQVTQQQSITLQRPQESQEYVITASPLHVPITPLYTCADNDKHAWR